MRITVAAAVACLIGGVAIADSARAAVRRTTEIPAQDLKSALQSLATERAFQILYRTEVVGERQTAGASGELSMDEALTHLLSGTGLSYQYLDDKTITITPLGAASKADAPKTSVAPTSTADTSAAKGGEKPSFWSRFRMAQVDQGSPVAPVDAAPSGEGSQPLRLEEIVVTAQKREERLVDVPISIVAVSGEDLQKRGIGGIDDLATTVPGLSIQNSGLERRIVLRGVSNFSGSNSSLIGMYLDEASATSTRNAQLDLSIHDLERVEVLRGPQGTLYGEGSLGGTIRFVTKDPALDRFLVSSGVEARLTQDGGPSQRVETVLNMPLIAEELGLRVAALYDHDGGWIDQPVAGKDDYNGRNLMDIRTKGLWRPSANLTVSALAQFHRNNTSTNHGEDANGNYTQVFDLTSTPRVRDDYDIYNLTFGYDFSSFKVLSTSTYLRQEKVITDYGYIVPFAPAPSAPLQVLSDFRPDVASFTHELRFSSTGSGPWEWTIGGYYRRFRFTSLLSYRADFSGPLPPAAFTLDSHNVSKSWALFGDTRYRITDRFSLGAGLRKFTDDQESVSGSTQRGSFDSVNPRVYAEYRVLEGLNTYASAAKGFRSGGFNAPGQPTYGPEHVWTYELGTKFSSPSRAVSADIAVFFSDYEDYQILGQELAPPFLVLTSNGGSARIKGVEWSFDWAPTEQWRLSTNGNYIDSYFYEIGVGASDHAVDDPLDFAARYTFTVGAERSFNLSGRRSFARLDYSQMGPQTFRLRSIGPFFVSESDVIQMLSFRTGMQWNEHVSLGLFAQNLLDDRGQVDPFAIEASAARARPRSYGVDFHVTFD